MGGGEVPAPIIQGDDRPKATAIRLGLGNRGIVAAEPAIGARGTGIAVMIIEKDARSAIRSSHTGLPDSCLQFGAPLKSYIGDSLKTSGKLIGSEDCLAGVLH